MGRQVTYGDGRAIVRCPICKEVASPAILREDSPVLTVADFLGTDDEDYHPGEAPWSRGMGYKIIRQEFARGAFSFYDLSHVYWLGHAGVEECSDYWYDRLIELITSNKITHVLAFGTTFKMLTGAKPGESYGLWTSAELLPKVRVTPAPSLDGLMVAPIGDFRVSIRLVGKALPRLPAMV